MELPSVLSAGCCIGVKECIKHIIPVLSKLCIEAINLPEPEEIERIPESVRKKHEKYTPYIRFEEDINRYRAVLYPYDGQRNDMPYDDACQCNLEEDINSVSDDLGDGMKMYETGRVCAALFLWKELYCGHWGRFHASQALYAMNHLCMFDYEDRCR